MPVYTFQCEVCGAVFSKRMHMDEDRSNLTCPEGHTPTHRLYAPPAIEFKGLGFYATDSRKSAGKTSPSSKA